MHRLHHSHRWHQSSIIKFIYVTYVIWCHPHQFPLQHIHHLQQFPLQVFSVYIFLTKFYNVMCATIRTQESKDLLHTSCCTGVPPPEFLHRSSYTGIVIQDHTRVVTGVCTQEFTSRRATCICEFLRNYYFEFFLFLNLGGGGSQAAGYEAWPSRQIVWVGR